MQGEGIGERVPLSSQSPLLALATQATLLMGGRGMSILLRTLTPAPINNAYKMDHTAHSLNSTPIIFSEAAKNLPSANGQLSALHN